MDTRHLYMIIGIVILAILTISSFRRGFHPVKFIMQIIGLLVLPELIFNFYQEFLSFFRDNSSLTTFVISFIGGIVLYYLVLKRWIGFSTFEHELTHALVALLFFRRIKRFVVTKYKGGYIVHSGGLGGKFGDMMITLAPYYLPTFTFIFVLARPFLPPEWFPWWDILIGLSFAWQAMDSIDELRRNWTSRSFRTAGTGTESHSDIFQAGYIFSFIMLIVLKLLVLGILLYLLNHGYKGMAGWFSDIIIKSKDYYLPLFLEVL